MATKPKTKPKRKPKRKLPSNIRTTNPATGGVTRPITNKPVDWLANRTPADISDSAAVMARSQVQPTIDDAQANIDETRSANAARMKDLTNWGQFQQGQLNSAYDNARSFLDSQITSKVASDQVAQDALAAALRRTASPEDALGRMLGTNGPANNEAAVLNGAALNRASSEQALRDQAGAYVNLAGANRGLANTQFMEEEGKQNRRMTAAVKGFQKDKQNAVAQIPGLQQTAFETLQNQETEKAKFRSQQREARASRIFQQWLSKQQLGVQKKAQELEMAKFLHQKEIDWANVGLQKQQINNQLAQIQADADNTKDANKKARLEAKGKAIANAIGSLDAFMTPQKGEARPGDEHPAEDPNTGVAPTIYRRRFNDAYALLRSRPGITRKDALKILMHSTFPSWQKEARMRYNAYYKKHPKQQTGGTPEE